MKASHEAIKKENVILSNSEGLQAQIIDWVEAYSECDRISREQNEKRQEIREKAKDAGLDSLAFQARYTHFKLERHKQDAYNETVKIMDEALHKAENRNLWKWMDKPEKEKAPPKNAKKPEKSGKGKPVENVGQQQAAAFTAAHGAN